ncbi:hypothetical protein Rhal01_02161 [Rubritalea halochordaticola]|uniref:KTSC domain-containing protein n=1 Tax=Rubritalea halochordaticola TaxID=714537 RepID=A0ABP9V1X3_9BACT
MSFYLSPFDQHDDQTSGIEKPANDIAELPAVLKLIDADPQIYLFEGPPTGYYRYPNKIKLPLLTRFGYLFKRQGDHVLNDEHEKELIQVLTNPSHYSPLTSRNHHKPYRPDYAIQFSSGIDKVEIALSYRNHSARISHNGKETHYLNFHYPTEDTFEDPFKKVLHEYRDFIFVSPLTHPEENSDF